MRPFSESIPESELVLSTRGGVYHLDLCPGDVGGTIFLVGDPNRAKLVAQRFDTIRFEHSNREFVTITGTIRNEDVSVIGTGIGTDNIDIVINELDALFNIDLETRKIKDQKTSLTLVRLGTTGGIHETIEVGSIIASAYGLGLDGVLHFYDHDFSKDCQEIEAAFLAHFKDDQHRLQPYVAKASEELIGKFQDLKSGITITANGFYAPQGRQLRGKPRISDFETKLSKFECNGWKATNFEMETSALYGLADIFGHRALTLCTVIANRQRKAFLTDYHPAVNKMIDSAVESLF